ncbi:MAG: ribosome maturation factor RimM [Tissierellaceae bacterium]|jgi:16S rRNA processing protein RimM|nr:16S rRNA processing protein RimM [Tissierellia bacterium]
MEFTIIGKITNTHGIKGEVRVYPLTDNIERFSDLDKVYIGEAKRQASVKTVKYHKGLAILGFEEFDNINQVLDFKDQYLYIDDEDRIVLPEDRYFIFDLIGCEVFDMANKSIGHIVDVILNMGNDVYVIKNHKGDKEYLIPAVKEFIKTIDIDKKKIVIDPIEGMIE